VGWSAPSRAPTGSGNPTTALGAILLMSIWQAVGFHMVIWLSGLQTIPGDLYEASSLDGASSWQDFRYVTWPSLRQTRTFILVTITIQAFALFAQIQVMTQGGRRPAESGRSGGLRDVGDGVDLRGPDLGQGVHPGR
jgi:ABC-type sugar transport system permease subunit